YALEAVGAAFGDVSAVRDRLADTADAYALRDAASLDQCLHVLLLHLVQAVRLRSPYTQSRHLRMDDIERLPPLPPQPGQLPLSLPRAHVRRAQIARARATASDTRSDGAASADDGDGAEYGDSAEDDDDDDDGAARAARALFGGDGGLDGLSRTLRHANARDRLDSSTPFPRLCGGTFSGAGTLVCFFASIYTPDSYPGDDGAWERSRREMDQQLRALTKPRSLDKLGYYTRMVRFGLEHRGSYLHPDDSTGGGSGFAAAASAAAAAVRDEDAPRYYFRPNVGRTTPGFDGVSAAAAASAFFRAAQPYMRPEPSSQGSGGGGVGNSAVVCRAPEDRTASLSLARQLVVAGPSPAWVCTHNAAAYAMAGAARLAAVWALVASLVEEHSDQLQAAASVGSPWSAHPSVLAWLAAVLRRLERRGDAQTLALLACVLAPVLAVSADPSRAESADLGGGGGGGGIERAVDDQKPVLPPMLTPPIDPAADDSGEIERLMAEGMGGGVNAIGDASREPTPAASSPASPSAEAADGAAPGSASASAASAAAASDAPNDAADDADDGNIWRRLRSNVLGRVQPPTKQQPAVVAETAAAAAADASAAAATSDAIAAASACDTPLPPAHQRPRRAAMAAPDAVVGPLATSSATRGVQASYSRSKRLFERRHTRVAMRRDPGGLASADLRLQTAYLDHWKLVYARVLYRWGMDAKAAEIVSCVADPSLRALLRDMYFQPSLATDDNNETGIKPVAGGSTYPPRHSGRIRKHQHHQLVCAWCAEFVRGRALVCHACGHGGHKDHMLRWFRAARARLSRCGLVESSPCANVLLDSDDDDAGRGLSLSSLRELSSGLALHHAFDSASSDSDEDGDAAAAVRAGMMPDGAPTCPAGCGCNCLFESQKLFQ
ncbi:GATOR complex protein wdr59, partial [Coemansia sp. RSA 2049]